MTDEDASPKPNQPEPREPAAVEEFFPDEHRRSVPKIAWWILGIACVALLAFLLVRPEWFTRSADDDSLHVPADRHFTKTLASLDHPDGLWLNDDASSTSFTVKLPVDSKRSDTRIRLTGTTQVANDSTVFLTVSVDGTQVYRSELPRGDNPLNTLVGIPADAAADGSVRIVVRTDGSLHNQTCATDRSPGANVHLDSTTLVEAALDEPVHTVRDVVASWDHDLTVVLGSTANEWRTAAAQLGLALTRAGHRVTFAGVVPADRARNTVLVGPASTLHTGTGWSGSGSEPIEVGTIGDTPVLALVNSSAQAVARFLNSPTLMTADSGHSDPRAVPGAALTGNEISLRNLGADMSSTTITEDHT